jgi:hypothetical protein
VLVIFLIIIARLIEFTPKFPKSGSTLKMAFYSSVLNSLCALFVIISTSNLFFFGLAGLGIANMLLIYPSGINDNDVEFCRVLYFIISYFILASLIFFFPKLSFFITFCIIGDNAVRVYPPVLGAVSLLIKL